MTTGIHKKLARSREVAHAAGFLLEKLEARFGDQFGVGLGAQVAQAINECRQQRSALMSVTAKTAVEAEAMHGKCGNKGGAK